MFPEDEETNEAASLDPIEVEMKPVPTARVVRFVFEADAEGRFTFVSPELAATVGEKNGAVVGLGWMDVARVLGFADGAESAFTGGAVFDISVAWPTDGGAAVAVGLTGAPVFGPAWALAGYRGFGAIRPDQRQRDERADAIGLDTLREAAAPVVEEATAPTVAPAVANDAIDLDEAAQWSIEQGVKRGRGVRPAESQPRPATPREEPPAITGESAPSNIVRLPGAPPRGQPERLTGSERDAFRRIAEALGTRRAERRQPPEEGEAAPARKEIVKAPAAEIDTRLLDRLPIGIVLFRDRRTLFANRTLLDMLGYDAYDAFVEAGGAEAIFPGREGLASNIAEAGGKLAASRRDGGTVPVKAWLHAVGYGGATALMLSLSTAHVRDDADEDAVALEMARVEARAEELEAILDTATDGVVVIDGRGKIGIMNHAAEALFGVEANQYLGRYFTDLLADESQKAALDYLDGLAANGVASVLNDGREVIGRVPAGRADPAVHDHGADRHARTNSARCSATSPTGRTSRRS